MPPAPRGARRRAEANLEALQLLRRLEGEGRPATADEQQVISRWSGWGAAPVIFEPRPAEPGPDTDDPAHGVMRRWMELDPVRGRLRELLSDEEWAEARRNTVNAHYTDVRIGKAVWETVVQLGFEGGRVLEPGSGLGHFMGLAPADTALPIQMTGVEVEPATAALSRQLYPDAEVVTAGFEDVVLEDSAFDATVANVPFGKFSRYDKIHNKDLSLRIHDHFILKSLTATRPGGIVAVITSRHTLDNKDTGARERLHQLGDLVGAIRLPYGSHKAAAGTDAVMDVLFLRRRLPGEQPTDATWLHTRKVVLPGHDEAVRVNDYILEHPEYVLGELRAHLTQYEPRPTVVSDGDAAEGLAEAGRRIAEGARAAGLTATAAPASRAHTPALQVVTVGLTEGALGLDEAGNPTIVEDGRVVALDVHPDQRDRLVQLIDLKSKTLALYAAEADTTHAGETLRTGGLRTALREAYGTYRKKHPPLAKPRQAFIFTPAEAKERAAGLGLTRVPDEWKAKTAFAFIDDDPEASLLFGLEVWDDRTGTATEQPVLHKRVLEPRDLPKHADTPEDAVALALEWDGGRLDMRRVASLLSVDEEEAQRRVAHLAFRDPVQGGFWEPRHRYLSGNVREKLRRAQEAAAEDPVYTGNVAALERVQPEDLTPAEIKARCGAPWIPVSDYRDFLVHLGFEHAEVRHAGGTVWEIGGASTGDLARKEWGTEHRSAQDLMLAILRQADSTVTVTFKDKEGKIHVDLAATDAAREKARLLVAAFDDWIWADEDRAARLAGIYNETFNSLVLPEYDRTKLTLPGLVSTWKMRPHQNAAIRRIISEPTALLAHVVGAGKTATMVGATQELRRTGLARKPAMVVPNHMLKQITREYRQLYPNAKLLAISATDLSAKKRAKFMARMAGGDWDAVVMTHEAFNRVPLRPETQQAYLDTEMASLYAQVEAAKATGMQDRTVKDIETKLADAEARLTKQIQESSNTPGVCLEDTGVDYLMLDEAHEYKNLRTVSAIPGAGIQGSMKATKLHMVLGYLREANGHDRVATLATGTPIANSVAEAYVMKRYLGPDLLQSMGLDAFDNWAATFGEVVTSLEPDAKGDGYKQKARFARFFNVPELMSAYRSFADVQMAEDLNLPLPTVQAGPDGQRGETVHFPVTGSQRSFIKALPKQAWVREPGGVLKALGLGLRASLDMRLVGGEEDDGSKLEYAAEKIADIWRDTKDTVYPVSKDDPTPQPIPGGLQLVFCDEGTPGSGAENPVDVYGSLREHLVAAGLPRDGIRFIHEASTDKKKERLFADCRSGRVSVLIGSTKKMGTGTNIQDRSTALHHLSYPWRPADMAQRDGRLERQGNLNDPTIEGTPDHVRILYYVTQGSFDEFRLNTLARKARFISQIQRRDFRIREIEDIGDDAVNLGLLSALAAEDPTLMKQAEATAERARLQGLARTWDREQDSRARTIKDLDAYLPKAVDGLAAMRAALPKRRPTNGDAFSITIDGRTMTSRDAAAAALGARMVTLARDLSLVPGVRTPIGTLGGCDFHGEITYNASGQRQLQLRFEWGSTVPLGHRDDRAQWLASSVTESNGRGAVTSLENLLNRLDKDAERLNREIEVQRTNQADATSNLRSYEDNPYRVAARSKEREEKLLGQLVIANEKIADLKERMQKDGERPDQADADELEEFSQKADELRALIADEHLVQEGATTGTVPAPSSSARSEPSRPAPPAAAARPAVQRAERPARGAAASDEQREPTVEEMVLHDARAMAGLLGGTVLTQEELAALLGAPAPEGPEDTTVPSAAPEPPTPASDAQPADATAKDGTSYEAWLQTAAEVIVQAAAKDPQVADWARANDLAGFRIPMKYWVEDWLGSTYSSQPLNTWPDWVRVYFLKDANVERTVLADLVAETLHPQYQQENPQTVQAATPSEKHLAQDPSTGSPEPAAHDTAAQDPELEALRQNWLASDVWNAKVAAEGRRGEKIHLSRTPGYALIEHGPTATRRWEVVPAATGQQLTVASYAVASFPEPDAREAAEDLAARLDIALRAVDGTTFEWPPTARWRSATGLKLDRALAEARAEHDRAHGLTDSPGIRHAQRLAQRDSAPPRPRKPRPGAQEDDDPVIAQIIAQDMAAMTAAGWTEVVQPFASQEEAKAERVRVQTAGTAYATEPSDPETEAAPPEAPADTASETTPPAEHPTAADAIADADPAPPAEPAYEQAPSPAGDPEAPDAAGQAGQDAEVELEEGDRVITPDGPGTVTTLYGDLALVSADTAGSRVWHTAQLQREDQPGVPILRTAEIEKRQQNAADTDRAATPGGIPLYYEPYRRLRDLDIEAGHGTVVEGMTVDWDNNVHEAGEVVGWVRARMGDNGKRYWWAQDARGGPPDDMPFHESLPAKAGVPAIRAAGMLDTDRKPSSKSGHSQVITPPYAVREIKLTTAQVALLRTLPMVGTYPDGSDLPTPPWVGEHRRYVMSVAQMQALRVAAEAAADTCDTTTTVGRRSRKVLLNAADKLHFEEYETARRGASIPPIGEPDPYAGPYTPRPPRPDPDVAERTASPAEAKEAVLDNEQPDTSPVQPAVPAPEQEAAQRPTAQAEETPVEEQDQAEIPGMADTFDPRSGSVPVDGPAPKRPEPAAAEDAPPAEPVVPTAGAVGSTAGDAPDDAAHGFAPQDRVFHDAMRYVVESVSPDGTVIRTIDGQDLPAAEVVAEADMPPVTTEDLAEGWWRFTYEGRSYTATTLPPDLARAHPTAVLNTVIVDEEGALVGRSFGRPHESAIIWAHAHPGIPHPHVAEWLGTTPTPWPDHTPAEIEHVTAGPPPAEPDGYDEETARPDIPAASGDAPISEDRPTATDAPSPEVPAPDSEELVPPGASPVEGGTAAKTRAVGQPSPDPAVAPADDLEEHDMTVTPEIEPVAPDVEDPPEPERYTETTGLPLDPEFALRLYGWDGQPPESGELLYRDTVIAAVRPSQGGGWFARLSAEGLPADVTSLVASPFQAAHEGAVYFSALTAVPYGEPIPDAQNVGRLTRADVVRTALRDAAGMNRDLITAAAARAWPTTYGSNPHLQHLVERLFEMQNALIDTADARRMAADMEAVEQAATVLRGTLPEDPAAPERQHMGFRLAHLLYDTTRLKDHMRAALEATRAEREEQTVADHRDAVDEPAVASFPDPPEPQPEPDLPPDPEMELEADVPDAPPEQYVRTTALDEDVRFSLRMSGEVGQDPDYGEVLEGRVEFAIVRYSAAGGGWYGQITDPGTDLDFTPPVATPQEAAHHSAILYSIGYGSEYGEAPAPAEDTDTATRADVVRAEMAAVAVRHRDAIIEAAARVWPTAYEDDRHLLAVTDALDGLAAAPHEALYVNQMEERLNAVDAAAMTWASYLPAVPGPERQHMIFPLYHLARDARRLEARLQATAAAVRKEREALRQTAVPEVEPAVEPVVEAPTEPDVEPAAGPEAEAPAEPDVEVDQAQQPTLTMGTADQEQSAEAGEPVLATPEQFLDVSATPPSPPQPTPEAPESGPALAADLVVPADERPEGEANPAATPRPEHPAESADSSNGVEDVLTAASAGDEQGTVVSEQPDADLLPIEEPAPVEHGGEAFLFADLPLWTGPDPEGPIFNGPDANDSELLSDLSMLQEAVEVLAGGGVPHEFREALHDELAALERALDGPVPIQPVDSAEESERGESLGDDARPGTSPHNAAEVNRALAAADQHQAALSATPEWQDIQTVRGAARNLWEAIKRQTGVQFQQLMGDGRVQAWWKKTSIRICEKIATLAMQAADRLRGDAPEPAACMDRLHEAADRYGQPPVPPRDDESELQKRMRKLGDGLAASQVKVNAARSRSTTVRKPPKPRGAPADRPEHLRRTAADPKRGPRPGR
ncbi:DEAD/DEAH box helicase family protein [Streptomyces lavendulae]|uniref:DEAD/DEAH box helicase family protein n=1 Tax=Streptomyces lavendulae TaxID=1914 RepID=UPI0036C1D7E6